MMDRIRIVIAGRIVRWLLVATIGCAVVTAASLAQAQASGRIALVMGNSAYRVGPLRNPANDARDMAKALGQLGFSVTLVEDVVFKDMVEAFQEFARRAPAHEVRVLYYAGHGLQFKDSNYLIPVDADLKEETEIARQTFLFDHLVDRLAQIKGGVNIYILDACRHNPFSNIVAFGRDGRRIKLRGGADAAAPVVGLAPPKRTAGGSFVAFSTTPGQVAADTPGERNSVYAKHLLRNITIPGLRIEDVFQRVRRGVKQDTQDQQVPWEQTSLDEPFCFKELAGRPCG